MSEAKAADRALKQAPADAPPVPQADWMSSVQKIIRSVAIILVLQYVFTHIGSYIKKPVEVDVAKPSFAQSTPEETAQRYDDPTHNRDYSVEPRMINPLWKSPMILDIKVYLSESLNFHDDGQEPYIFEQNIQTGAWTDVRKISKMLDLSQFSNVLNNGSLYAHVYTYRNDKSPQNPDEPHLPDGLALKSSHLLTRFMPRRRDTTVKSLLGGSSNETALEKRQKNEIISYYHNNFTISMVGDAGSMPLDSVHPMIRPYITLDPMNTRDKSGMDGYYLPIIYENSFWLLQDHMYPINSTTPVVPFHFEFNQVGLMKMQMLSALDSAAKQQSQAVGGTGAEFEEIKRIFLETNFYLLMVTFVVSCLHSVFELLAFKNDIMHFRSKKDNTGVSVNAILMNVLMQTIILLYLLDNQEQASYVILIGQGFGIAVEAWKITKSVNVRIVQVNSIIPYRFKFEDKHQLNETEKATKEYDDIATRYLLYASIPLLGLYAAYSIIYEEHKGWWSFTITTLVGFVYFYGFATMIPSLYINYRLRSVAHMSSRALTYKFLNTIVDDFFAVIIKQPFLARLAAFRDDVVFVIFIYQGFIYKVDKTRVNEFGTVTDAGDGGEDEDGKSGLIDSPASGVEKSKKSQRIKKKSSVVDKKEQ